MSRLAADVQEMIGEQWQYRGLLYQMTYRDLLLRYKQTAMGFGWALAMPLVNTAVFSVIFMRVAPIETGMPYPLFAFIGLLAWNFLASALKFATNSLTSNSSLVTKIYFPREVFPVSAVLVCVVDFFVAGLAVFGMMAYYRIGLHWTIVFLPVVVVVQVFFTIGAALLLSMANLFYRDVKYIFEIALTVWMFLTSVVYPVGQVGGRLAKIMLWNPVTPIIESYRDVLVRGQLPGPAFAAAAVVSLVLFACAWLTFHRAEFQFAERV
ncbi:MAG TPA: ABC transporter permease [Terriglobales bacterium]|nr:ABC transporter permease [Terriglobales bacterium]